MRRPLFYATTVCVLMLAAISRPRAAADDIVFYAADATNVNGNWSLVADTTGAGGQRMSSVDRSWSSTDNPLAAPADFFETTFSAAANTRYHVWLRVKASGNSKFNDSVFVQFSDAVDANGSAIYRIGTTNGLLVNGQSCNGCALSGWGWLDGAYWLSQTTKVAFANSGTHTLRVQTREDGVSIDQIVLSPSTYLNAAPGAVMNDSTIVPKGTTSGGGGSGGSGESPFSGTPIAIPGTVDAANFDNGGEGVAYHDATAGNAGGAFRSTDVDLETSSDGGTNVGWISAGEWLNYTVNVAAAGSYTVELKVASPSGGGALHVGFNGPSNVWNSVSIPQTGDWQSWTTVSTPVTLGAGTQQLTLLFDTSGFNVRSIRVFATGGTSPPTQPPPPPPPSSGGGNTINVAAGGNLQAAIDSAQPGDTILLTPGATYRGIFNLPVKGGSSYITIRSAASDASLPGDGVRISPQYASQLPTIQGGVAGAPAFTTTPGAHHFRLQFLEIVSTYAANQIVELGSDGSNQRALSDVPHDLVIDRCYIHGDPTQGQKRGIALNSASTSIVNSYISDIKSSDEDTQAIAGWNGPGPYIIENNYLEAAGENILFGGGDPAIPNLVPSDISIRFNHVAKQPSWRGQAWTVKNLIELKNAQRVTIDSNVLEYCWAAGQSGYAIMLTPRNQDNTAPWSVVQHIAFTNNIVRHVSSGFSILGLDVSTTTVTNDVVVRNNLFDDMSHANWGGAGQLVLTQGGQNIVFDHNTVFTDGTSIVYADVTTVTGFVFTNNIVPDNAWAIMGGNASPGNGTLSLYYPGATVRGNVFIGASSSSYPANNFFPATVGQVGFVSLSSGNYRLSSSSPYKGRATDGSDIGCNMDALRP